MSRKRDTEPAEINVNFRADREMVRRYRAVVAQDQRNISQSLRLHMANVVADARANGELVEDAA